MGETPGAPSWTMSVHHWSETREAGGSCPVLPSWAEYHQAPLWRMAERRAYSVVALQAVESGLMPVPGRPRGRVRLRR
jgi:hypothetical protein